MNGTHRTLNRAMLTVIGIVMITVGVFTAWAGASPEMGRRWSSTGQDALGWTRQQLRTAPIPGTDTSWWTAAALLAGVLAIVLLMLWIVSQGGGRTNSIGTHDDAGRGTTTVDVSFAAQAITDANAGNDQILSTGVTAWKLKGTEALKITVQARRGASPAQIDSAVQDVIAGLDAVLGEQVPVLLRIVSGPRARFTRPERVH